MRGRNSSKYYRKSSYKKRKLRNILIISAICLLVLFLLFVIFGNRLNKKMQEERVDRDKAQTTVAPEANTAEYAIEAYSLDIASGADVSAQLKELSSLGVKSVSIKLTDSSGKLLIKSELARSLGCQSSSDGFVDISKVISTSKYYGMFTSAVLDLGCISEKDAKQRAVRLAYEASLAVEVSEKGIGDVIVRASGADASHTELLVDFANRVKSINDAVVLGVALPESFFCQESSAEDIAKLAECFDIIGLDISSIPKDYKNEIEYIERVFSESNIKYYVLRYNMRVLLPNTATEDDELRTVLQENSIQNWQKIS